MKQPIGVALLAAGVALALAKGSEQHAALRPPSGLVGTHGAGRLVAPHAAYAVQATTSRVTARTIDGTRTFPIDLELLVDGEPRPLSIGHLEALPNGQALGAPLAIDLPEGRIAAQLRFLLDGPTEGLVVELVPADAERAALHELALRATFPAGGDVVFVSGVGEVGDTAEVRGSAVVLDDDVRPFGVTSALGEISVRARGVSPGAPLDVSATSPAVRADWGRVDLRFTIGMSSQRFWAALFKLAGARTAKLHGVVTGGNERAHVFGLDTQGARVVRAVTDESGRFELEVPKNVSEWYAALDPASTSPPITFEPGTPWDLRLDVSPGGELRARIVDGDTRLPLTARLLVHGVEGTLDPSFGPDYRASGAGPIIDALRGEVATPLPAGRYRVAATRGIEWSVDAKVVDVVSGHAVSVELAPRHVVPTPGLIGCDLHVHARPSFDTPVSVEDRVLSLVAAGVDFAVPTEHNIVGDYAGAIESLDVGKELAHAHGVEITTFAPRLGHFGVFPYPLDQKVPPYRHTSIPAIFDAAHKGDPDRILQVNHPRLPKGIGYFEIVGFDPKTHDLPRRMRTDFDTLEVYNGYDLGAPGRVDAVLADWFALLNLGHRYVATGSSDSHRIQYQWAGYPRTMIDIGPSAEGPAMGVNPLLVVARLKKGHAFVTSGPILELDVQGAHPGDEVTLAPRAASLAVHLLVRAAPWIDVTSFDVVVDGKTVRTVGVPTRATVLGAELGTLAEAGERTIRYDATVEVPIATNALWLVIVARGTRLLDDVLAFMPVAPMAITNPVWIVRTPGAAGAESTQH